MSPRVSDLLLTSDEVQWEIEGGNLGVIGVVRAVYRVLPDGDQWVVKKDGLVLSRHRTKDAATRAARVLAIGNKPSQVVVHRRDGTIETEWTYGNDPAPPPG